MGDIMNDHGAHLCDARPSLRAGVCARSANSQVLPTRGMNSRRLITYSSGQTKASTTSFENVCAPQQIAPNDFRIGSFASVLPCRLHVG
jgi:hypothetical protein